jgi:hypothetical protein
VVEKEPLELTGTELSVAAPNTVFVTEIFASGVVVPEMRIVSVTTSDEKVPLEPTGVMSCVTGLRTSEGSEAAHIGEKSEARNIETNAIDIAVVRQWTYLVKRISPRFVGTSGSFRVLTLIWRNYK